MLLTSKSKDRSTPNPLAGAVVKGKTYVFLGPATDQIAGLSSVAFFIDDRAAASEASIPYDLNGTNKDGSAQALDTSALSNGSHELRAEVRLSGGPVMMYRATFTVKN